MVTLKQIAQRVNVSTSVVSHVLNSPSGNTRVSQAKRELIEQVAREMQYVPNLRARSLVTRRTQMIGFVTSRSYARNNHKSDAYFHAILHGVEDACRSAGYKCLYARYEPQELQEIVYPRSVRDGSVDGIVFAGHTPAEALKKLALLNVPCVQVGTNVDPDSGVQCFTSDLGRAFEQVVRRLRELGHKRVQLVLPSGPGPEAWAKRFRNLASIVPGVEPEIALMPTLTSNRETALAHAAAVLKLRPHERPTAFICNPVHSQALAEGLATAGLSCPSDYSMVCFGLPESEDQRLFPGNVRMSFIVLPVEEAGRRAATALISRVNADGYTPSDHTRRNGGCATTFIPCEVLFSESCGPARGKD
jgi:DNA-binding LacI/PurR family transcriptional regulator